jgi:O-antigen/teichoic acid export membrane protein
MTQALPSTVKPDKKFRLRATIGDTISLWSPVRNRGAELSWVLVGKFALMGANAAVMLFLAHRLDLKTYGLLVVTISGQLLISRILMSGVDAGMVRLTAITELRSRSSEVVAAGLMWIVRTSIILLLVFLLALPVLSRFAVPGWVLASIVAGTIGTSLVDYGYSYRLARQEYLLAAFSQGGTALWRLLLTTLAAVVLPAYAMAVFVAYHGASLLSGLAQTAPIAKQSQLRPDRKIIKRLLRYSFWLGMANVIVILSLYQGTFLLMLLKQPAATGIFGLALTLSLGFFAIYQAYSEYLLVRVRSVEHIKDFRRFIKRAVSGALILMLACVPVVFAIAILMPRFLGPEWLEVVPIFVYLAASMVLLILQAPLVAACHYFLRPQLVTFGWVLRTVLIGVAGITLAQQLGATGVAIAQLIGSALALLVLSLLVAGSLRSATAIDA